MTVQPPKIIPLYVPETQEVHEMGLATASPAPFEGLTLLTSDNEVKLRDVGLDQIGHLEIIIYDTPQQARDACTAIGEFQKYDTESRDLMPGVAPSGEGILFIQNPAAAVFEYEVVDRRIRSEEHADEWFVSVSLDRGQFERMKEEIEKTPLSVLHARKVSFLGSQIESMGLTINMQNELESRKGGYISLETTSPESILTEKSYTHGGIFKDALVDDVREALLQVVDNDDISTNERFDDALERRLHEVMTRKEGVLDGPKI
ncbi:hypothetical protein [Sulfitobacter sp. R18_1]|uniref:hypothetical protein n=1 Tax=Sulfitobacter sp. R18_1 TaxID=2821104 RepID=UPI001ADA2580|nr:hypothetical protein [Sulfitobacter sp. R18_1]MBO9428673.1 hypothetical protein [Sulfitobacter sp. R18_1]